MVKFISVPYSHIFMVTYDPFGSLFGPVVEIPGTVSEFKGSTSNLFNNPNVGANREFSKTFYYVRIALGPNGSRKNHRNY
jgi:hypothetical protein